MLVGVAPALPLNGAGLRGEKRERGCKRKAQEDEEEALGTCQRPALRGGQPYSPPARKYRSREGRCRDPETSSAIVDLCLTNHRRVPNRLVDLVRGSCLGRPELADAVMRQLIGMSFQPTVAMVNLDSRP